MTEESYRWVDSSGRLEYMADTGQASFAALNRANGPTHPSLGQRPRNSSPENREG